MKTADEILKNLSAKIKSADTVKEFAKEFLWLIAKELEASQGAFFIADKKEKINILRYVAGYAYHIPESQEIIFEFGEGLAGQVAKEGKAIYMNNVPEGYITILSGLGQSTPTTMVIFPLKINEQVKAVVEIASFKKISDLENTELEKLLHELEKSLEKYLVNS